MLSHLLVALIGIVVMASVAGSVIYSAAQNELQLNLEQFTINGSNLLFDPLRELYLGQGDILKLEQILNQISANNPDIRYTLFLRDGSVLFDSRNQIPDTEEISQLEEVSQAFQSPEGKGTGIRLNDSGEREFYVARRIESNGDVYGVLRTGFSLDVAESRARYLGFIVYLVGAALVLLMTVFGWFLARTISRPIQELTQVATQLARGDLDARVRPSGPRELRHLAQVFNTMASRLQTHVDELRAFAANASHELRTPLTIVKLRVEALQSGALNDPAVATRFLEEVESEVDRLGRLVSDLLELSRMEAGLSSKKRSQLDLGELVDDVCETFGIRAESLDIKIDKDISPNLPEIYGDEDGLYRVVNNLLDNAIRYSPKGSKIVIRLFSKEDDQRVRLEVIDMGPGIAPEHLPHLFERFYRAEATRPKSVAVKSSSGSGLGLAIAKSIVDIHGGKIGVQSELEKGSTFWVELPVDW